MTLKARIYIWIIVAIGASVLITQLSQWRSENMVRYLIFLVLTVAASSLKISLPAVTGTMSASFLLILFGVMEFSLPETLLVGALASVIQCLCSTRRRPQLIQIVFNTSSLSIAIAATRMAWHSPFLRSRNTDTAVMLLVAAVVFFTMNTLPIATVISLTEGKSLRRVWKDFYFWSLPYYLFGAAVAGGTAIATHRYGWQAALLVIPLVYLIYKSYNLYVGRTEAEKKHAQEMAQLHLRTIEALALAIEAKDHTTHDHLQRVQVYAIEIGRDLGLDESQIEALRAAALLHDIGKLAVPEHIISKPGRLTREEFDKMKIHPVVGAEILERVKFPYPVTPIVRAHHEKWNGSGYPDGLKGEEIPIGARILAAVDCLDALASDRQYRRALPLDEAMQRVSAESGISFDPKVVEILQRRYKELERMAVREGAASSKLSTNVKIERGLEPAAGFEQVRKPGQASTTAEKRVDFLASIAAARSEVQNLFELTKDLGNSLSLNETMSLLSIRLKRMIPYDAMAIYVQRENLLRPAYVTGENSRLFSSLEIPFGQGLSGWVAENKKPIINGNPSVEPGYLNDPVKFTTMRSALAVPLIGVGNMTAVLTLYHVERDAFTRDHLRILMAIAPKVALSVENALKYQQAESSAATDYMTGLPNARSLFFHLDAEISRCRRQNTPVAVLVCDMNGFKQINDRFGHLTGNRLLRGVATSLKDCCREYDYVARMGGDEFVLVFPGLKMETLQQTIQRLSQATCEAGKEITNHEIVSLSIGHAMYPEDGTDAEQLLSEADKRMYAAKQEHKQQAMDRRGYDFDTQALATRW